MVSKWWLRFLFFISFPLAFFSWTWTKNENKLREKYFMLTQLPQVGLQLKLKVRWPPQGGGSGGTGVMEGSSDQNSLNKGTGWPFGYLTLGPFGWFTLCAKINYKCVVESFEAVKWPRNLHTRGQAPQNLASCGRPPPGGSNALHMCGRGDFSPTGIASRLLRNYCAGGGSRKVAIEFEIFTLWEKAYSTKWTVCKTFYDIIK